MNVDTLRLGAGLLAAVLLLAAPLGGAVGGVGQPDAGNGTATPTATPSDAPAEDSRTPTATPSDHEAATDTSPTPKSDDGPRYSLAKLEKPGRQLDNSPPSVRLSRNPGLLVWMKHVPAASPSGGWDRDAAKFVSRDTNVKRNEVYLRANLVRPPPGADNMTAVVATYRVGTDENGSEVVRNLSVRREQVAFQAGFAQSKVSLPQIDGDPKRVTVWLRSKDGDRLATWRFRHRSAATTQEAPLPADASRGDVAMWAVQHYGLPILVGAILGAFLGFIAIRKALAGPGSKGVGTLLIIALPGLVVLVLVYFNLVELFVTNPILTGIPAAALLCLLTVLYGPGERIEKGLLLRPSVTEVESPSGEDGVDFENAEDDVVKLVDAGDDGKAIVEEGWLPFFARIYGGLAVVENWHEARALTRVTGKHDWWHVLSATERPHGDHLYRHIPPSLTLSLPESRMAIAVRALVVAGAGLVGWSLYPGNSIALGVLSAGAVAVLVSLDGADGEARIPFGSKHHRRAYATASKMAEEMDAADSVDKAERERMKEKATTERKAREKAAGYESEYIGAMLGADPDLGDLVDADGGGGGPTSDQQVAAALAREDISREQAVKLLTNGDGSDADAEGGEA
jgi:hypothetical protein